MTYFVVLLVLAAFFLSINSAYGLWLPQTPQELLEESQVVFVGTITAVNVLEFEESSTSYVEEDGVDKPIIENYVLSLEEYSVNVEEFLKNPQNSNSLTVRQPTTSIPGKIIPFGGFDVGNRVLFYIEELDGTNTYSKESFLIPEQCDPTLVIHEPRMIGGDFRMMQNGMEKQDNFTANSPIQFIAERDMGTLSGASLSYDAYISKQVGKIYKERVFNQTITADSKPCQWMSVATWEFTPDAGNYLLNGRVYETKSNFGIHNTFFSVWPESPLKQFKAGIAIEEIQCKNHMHVLTERPNGKVACVYEATAEKLGWKVITASVSDIISVFEVVKDDTIFDIEYYIKGGFVEDMIYDENANSLLTTIDSTGEGKFTLTLPRDFIDAKLDYCPPLKANPPDDRFFVLLDGEEILYEEILTTSEKRTLQIPFLENTTKMEIIATCLI